MRITIFLAIFILAFAGERGPDGLRGKVAGVTGNRIQIAMDQKEWLPRAGAAVKLGAEMAGMFVPRQCPYLVVKSKSGSR